MKSSNEEEQPTHISPHPDGFLIRVTVKGKLHQRFIAKSKGLEAALKVRDELLKRKPVRAGKYRGVDVRPNRMWTARICIEGKLIHLGTFKNAVDAARAYDEAALLVFGSKAHPNFPRKRTRRKRR